MASSQGLYYGSQQQYGGGRVDGLFSSQQKLASSKSTGTGLFGRMNQPSCSSELFRAFGSEGDHVSVKQNQAAVMAHIPQR